jgi:hypothetical protein
MRLAFPVGIGGDELSYTMFPILAFLGVLLAGGVALITDAGIRLLRDFRR